MSRVPKFELAGGSTVGRDHRVVPRNNQDSYWIDSRGDTTVAVVCDGCGSGAYSEVGAAIGARLVCQATILELERHGNGGTADSRFRWSRVERDVLSAIHSLAMQMGGNYRETIESYFLFTITGVVLLPDVVFFGLGDGVTAINGDIWSWSFTGNAPPYLGYQLLDTDLAPDELRIRVRHTIAPHELDSFLIGCDGVGDFQRVGNECRMLPGMAARVGPLSQFWSEDSYFTNPAAISRRLKVIARDWPLRDPEHGLLPDDTTIIVGRATR